MWPGPSRPALGYPEMGMFVVAPATSFHHDSLIPDAIPSSSIGVIPLFNVSGEIDGHDLTNNRNRTAAGVPLQFWQNQQQIGSNNNNSNNYAKKTIDFESAGGGNSLSSSSTATCQDCGNQAKKDCPHRRCRTCCRSRGLDCSTHVKSTWVPAARRRERQLIGAGGTGADQLSISGAKKPRMIVSSATTTSSNTVDTGSSGHQDAAGGGGKGSMPAEVKAPAVFKCVRVSAVEGGEDEFAYQAVVKIGGHVFKGLLYDKGVHHARDGFPNLSELHLGGGGGGGGGGGERNGVSSTSPIPFPADVYGSGAAGNAGGFLGGSSFGNTMN